MTRVLIFPYPGEDLSLSIFLITAILVSVKWYLTALSQMTHNVIKHLSHMFTGHS